MDTNLLKPNWSGLDSFELRLLLKERVGGSGQYDGREDNPNRLYLPLARSSCRVVLKFDGEQIDAIEPGPAFDAAEWERISQEIETSILAGSPMVGRGYSFSSFRVPGSWRGERSGVQILPPHQNAPCAPCELADHPFILEFPIDGSDFWPVTNHRRLREHRRLTLLLNVLLAGRTSLPPRRPAHFWAGIRDDCGRPETKWVQEFFFAELGDLVIERLSPPACEQLEEVYSEGYYGMARNPGTGLPVPADLDSLIRYYLQLSPNDRAMFDRATFWLDMDSRQWNISMSTSFASLVSAIESLTGRGEIHRFKCPTCGADTQHEVPGATRRFRDFFDSYAPGAALAKRRSDMYSLRSGILHGSQLMQLDQDLALGWDPPWWDEFELHEELWGLTRVALRNWLKNQPSAC